MVIINEYRNCRSQKANLNKLVLIIPSYARTWEIPKDAINDVPPFIANKAGNAGPNTKKMGLLSYSEVCTRLPNVKNGNNPQNPFTRLQQVPENLAAGNFMFY